MADPSGVPSSSPLASSSIVNTIESVAETFSLCRNRVWEIAKMLTPPQRELLLQILAGGRVGPANAGRHEGHDQCTFDFCEHSRLDFTSVAQRHEACAEAVGGKAVTTDGARCGTRAFDGQLLINALMEGKATAWKLDGKTLVERPRPYMAISHVWSDGTGAGSWPAGQVNECLFNFFAGVAERFGCEGLWWDTVCIPGEKAARSKAIIDMQQNYQDARITLVHDCFIRQWEWTTPEVACIAIAMSPWFSRGWTALELAKSRKVKVMFRDGVVKDLNEDILARCVQPIESEQPQDAQRRQQHDVAASIIERLKEDVDTVSLDTLLSALSPRHTSWPRDVAIIAGQLAGVFINPRSSQQDIYQSVLRRVGQISHDHLFHNSMTMTKAFTWCPTNMFDLPMSRDQGRSISIARNGDLVGNWDVHRVPKGIEGRYNWKQTHPLLESMLKEALEGDDQDQLRLLFKPSGEDSLPMALLVKLVSGASEGPADSKFLVRFLGTLDFHPPLTREELGDLEGVKKSIIIVGSRSSEMKAGQAPSPAPMNLLSAASSGDCEGIKMLLKKGKDARTRDEERNSALHLAVRNGHAEAVDALLGSKHEGYLINFRNKQRATALDLATRKGDREIIELLIRYNADLDVEDRDAWTALRHATWNCYESVVRALLKGGANPQFQDRLGRSALHLAAERGSAVIVEILLDEMKHVHHGCRSDGGTTLHRAAWSGSVAVTRLLLDRSANAPDENAVDQDGRTPLHVAVEHGYHSVADLLLQHGGIPDIQDKKGQAPLHLAAKNGYERLLAQLLPVTEVELEDHTGSTPLLLAVRNGHLESTKAIVAAHADVQSISSGRAPLAWAAERGDVGIVRLLLEAGADPDVADSDGQTPLGFAAENGHANVAALLLENGAETKGLGSDASWTPLRWAVEKGYQEIVELLLKKKNIQLNNKGDGEPLLHVAAREGHLGVLEVLLKHGANPESRTSSGVTTLAVAAKYGHPAVVAALLRYRVELESMAVDLGTPLAIAAKRGDLASVRLLLEQGASAGSVRMVDIAYKIGGSKDYAEIIVLLIEHGIEVDFDSFESRGSPLIILAALANSVSVAAALLEKGEKLESKDLQSQSALIVAARHGKVDVAEFLIEKGADIEARDFMGFSALFWAHYKKEEAVIKLLLKKGANPLSKWAGRIHRWAASQIYKDPERDEMKQEENLGGSLLIWAARTGETEVVRLLLQKGFSAARKTDEEDSPLLEAAKNGHAEVLALLLDNGAEALYEKDRYCDPVSEAFKGSHAAALEVLLERGLQPRPNKSNHEIFFVEMRYMEILRWAKNEGHTRLIEIILKDCNNLQYERVSPWERPWLLHLLVESSDRVVVEQYLATDYTMALEDVDGNGQTALFHAIGNTAVLKLLLEWGADPYIRDRHGRTAVSRAVARGFKDSVKLLSSPPERMPSVELQARRHYYQSQSASNLAKLNRF